METTESQRPTPTQTPTPAPTPSRHGHENQIQSYEHVIRHLKKIQEMRTEAKTTKGNQEKLAPELRQAKEIKGNYHGN